MTAGAGRNGHRTIRHRTIRHRTMRSPRRAARSKYLSKNSQLFNTSVLDVIQKNTM